MPPPTIVCVYGTLRTWLTRPELVPSTYPERGGSAAASDLSEPRLGRAEADTPAAHAALAARRRVVERIREERSKWGVRKERQ